MLQMDAFAFETAKEVFSNSIVIRVALAGHALTDAEIRQPQAVSVSGILDAAVRESIADDLFGAKVFDGSEIEPAFVGRNVGNIANTGLVGSIKRKLAHE